MKKILKSLPTQPGVYLMKDKENRIIYIGKASNIKKRVSSYFGKPQANFKNQTLLKLVCDVEAITTDSEHQALLLESQLIKKLKPRYNVSLKDDKSFPFIKITKQDYPRLFIGRRKFKEKVEYIGPYTNAKLLRLALKSLKKVFPFCSCNRFPKKACLNFHLGLCPAPCIGRVSKAAYKKNIRDLKHFLKKGSISLRKNLEERMQYFSKTKNFEEAIKVREKIKALGLLFEQSRPESWQAIGLDKQPNRIEGFDISNIFGNQAVGSMVTFLNGQPYKNGYRRFKIRITGFIDDYKMLKEVLGRRYGRVVAEGLNRPDLVIIDGGRGHLNIAVQQLKEFNLDIPIIAIAKEQELIYTVEKQRAIKLDKGSIALQLIQRVRDEAHRFAVNYHRLLRKKKAMA